MLMIRCFRPKKGYEVKQAMSCLAAKHVFWASGQLMTACEVSTDSGYADMPKPVH